MVSRMCGVQLNDMKRVMDLLMLGMNETIDLVGYCKHCSLVWSYIEEGGWSCLV